MERSCVRYGLLFLLGLSSLLKAEPLLYDSFDSGNVFNSSRWQVENSGDAAASIDDGNDVAVFYAASEGGGECYAMSTGVFPVGDGLGIQSRVLFHRDLSGSYAWYDRPYLCLWNAQADDWYAIIYCAHNSGDNAGPLMMQYYQNGEVKSREVAIFATSTFITVKLSLSSSILRCRVYNEAMNVIGEQSVGVDAAESLRVRLGAGNNGYWPGTGMGVDMIEVAAETWTVETCQDIWLSGQGMPLDLNQNCIIDLPDFAELSHMWMECNNPDETACP